MSHHHHHHHHHHHRGRCAVIRNPKSGLVLDASEYVVKLQHFNGRPTQLWKFEEICPGKYFISNEANRKVLDIEGGVGNGHNLITFAKHGRENQQWYINADGTISSSCGHFAVDICKEHYCAGNNLIAFKKHGRENQQFKIEYV